MSGRDLSPGEPGSEAIAATGAFAIGELIALADDGATPMVLYAGQPGAAALAARTTVDLTARQLGAQVLLVFEGADPRRPIVTGVLRGSEPPRAWCGAEADEHVEVDADGTRVSIRAQQRLVLRCGDASITLTKAGHVLIRGSYVLTHSTGRNRVVGGSVELN